MDLVRALSLGGIRSVVVAQPEDSGRFSRATAGTLPTFDAVREPERLLSSLTSFAERQREAPPLYYDNDWDLMFVSRHREKLQEAFRFVIPPAELVEGLVDKERFQVMAEEMHLPVPPARRMSPDSYDAGSIDLRYPLVAKPLTRHPETWSRLTGGKALVLEDSYALRSLQEAVLSTDLELLLQEMVTGDETAIENYHVYVDEEGEIAGEFTGRKLRTWPAKFGFSSAVMTTAAGDVLERGRDITRCIGLRGVAKLDFKRSPEGDLFLLEVNPRFNLWHHPGAVAGVNLPALVYADLLQRPRPEAKVARPGVTWCHLVRDRRAARAHGLGYGAWLAWALRCEAKSGFAWDDPLPLPRAALQRLRHRLARKAATR